MNTRDKLKRLIVEGKTNEVISELFSITEGTNLYNEVIQQSAKLKEYKKNKRLDNQLSEELNIKLNQINDELLVLIDELPQATNTNKIWKYVTTAAVIIGIFGSLAEILNFINIFPNKSINITNSVTVLVHGKKGKDDIVLPNRGIVYLIYGNAKIPEQINNEGEATFKQIPETFFTPDARVEILFEDSEGEPYRVANQDSLYKLEKEKPIYLPVFLEGMDKIHGIVKDFATGQPLDSVMVRIFGNNTYSNEYGEFILELPENQQKQFITIRAIKEGYLNWEQSNVPTTTEAEMIIPLKYSKQ